MTGASPPHPEAAAELDHAMRRLRRLPIGSKLGYGAGQLVEMVVGSVLSIFMLFYATVVCGLPGGLAGLAVGIGLVVDAVLDPLVGSMSDGWRSRWGRRVPFMVVALPLILVSFNLLFALPVGLTETSLFLWLTTLSITLRVSLSLFTLPYQALGAEISDDYVERSSIAAWRWGLGLLGTFSTITLGYGGYLSGPGGTLKRDAYSSLTLTLSIILLIGGVLAIRVALLMRDRQHETEVAHAPLHERLIPELAEVFGNRTFRIMFATSLLFSVAMGVNQALGLHVATFFWHLPAELVQPMAIASVAGLVLGAPLSAVLAPRIEKRTMIVIGMMGMVVDHGGPVTLRLLGLLPWTGSDLAIALAVAAFLGSIFTGLTVISALSILPDAADEHEHLYGTRREGLYTAGWAFAGKAASGAGILIAGVVLDLVSFPTGVSHQGSASSIPDWAANTLALVGGPGASLLSMAAIGLVLLYRIDKRTHARIMHDLNARRAAAAEQSDPDAP